MEKIDLMQVAIRDVSCRKLEIFMRHEFDRIRAVDLDNYQRGVMVHNRSKRVSLRTLARTIDTLHCNSPFRGSCRVQARVRNPNLGK